MVIDEIDNNGVGGGNVTLSVLIHRHVLESEWESEYWIRHCCMCTPQNAAYRQSQ
jgi:hypothetical protein